MSKPLPDWPAALRLDQAAEYCGLSVEVFMRVCPIQPMPLADGRWLLVRLAEWKQSLPDDWTPDAEKRDFTVIGQQPGWVYVVGFSNYVKIGFTSKSVESRIASLQTGCPETLSVFSAFRGSKQYEAHLQRRFISFKTQGEWFRLEGDLRAWVEGGCR